MFMFSNHVLTKPKPKRKPFWSPLLFNVKSEVLFFLGSRLVGGSITQTLTPITIRVFPYN